jgi:5-methylcytosine-specific restriction endonuclease McrA
MAKSKREKLPKTRNAGTMTESAFWSMIRSTLRRKSMFWKPIQQAKNNSRRPYTGENTRQKWEYQCEQCQDWFAGKQIEVDHIVEVGSLKSSDDLKGFVDRLFVEDGFQVLCSQCHNKKTNAKRNEDMS